MHRCECDSLPRTICAACGYQPQTAPTIVSTVRVRNIDIIYTQFIQYCYCKSLKYKIYYTFDLVKYSNILYTVYIININYKHPRTLNI